MKGRISLAMRWNRWKGLGADRTWSAGRKNPTGQRIDDLGNIEPYNQKSELRGGRLSRLSESRLGINESLDLDEVLLRVPRPAYSDTNFPAKSSQIGTP